jgi:chromosome partitioning protein
MRMSKCKVISCFSQKGGVGKTTTSINLSVALAKQGKKVLLLDADSQGSATVALGYRNTDDIYPTISTLMERAIDDTPINADKAVLHHDERIDLIPANIELSTMEMKLINTMSRESILREVLADFKDRYDYAIIDCAPSLSLVPINALAASDSVLIPVTPQYLSIKGMDQLLSTVAKVRKQLNPELTIEGILLTITDMRTNLAREVKSAIHTQYGGKLNIFTTEIPQAVKAAEASLAGKSIFAYEPNSKVASAYMKLGEEVNARGERVKNRNADERVR